MSDYKILDEFDPDWLDITIGTWLSESASRLRERAGILGMIATRPVVTTTDELREILKDTAVLLHTMSEQMEQIKVRKDQLSRSPGSSVPPDEAA